MNQAFPNKYFNFSIIEKENIFDQIMKLKHKKATQDSDIPVKVLKENADFLAEYLYIFFNEAIESSKFLSSLKQANITAVFKKCSRNQNENCRPVSILPIVSKIFEKILSKQLYICFENILSMFQGGFRNEFSTQNCLLLMIEKWKEAVD